VSNEPILGFSGEYRFLSNFWFSTFVVDGVSFEFNEKWYMAHKTLDPLEVNHIMACLKPGECKAAGRTVTLRPDWEDVKDEVMLQGLRLKFGQNAELAQRLLDTGKRYLEETNTWGDTYWGVCQGKGKNMLGIQLMRVRAELS
jgi:N-glycosidase YbiA